MATICNSFSSVICFLWVLSVMELTVHSKVMRYISNPVIVCTDLHHKNLQFYEFSIHGSVHHTSILIRSNKMQQYAGIYLLQNHSLHVSGVHRTHHQENIKL